MLGGVLLDNEAIHVALERIQPDDFYRIAHSSIFSAMKQLADKREPIDVITLSQQLRSMGALEEAGGIESISRLASLVPSAANVGFYAKHVKEVSLRRKVIHEASAIASEAFDLEGSVEEFLDSAERRILQVSESVSSKGFVPVGDVVQESIRMVERLYDRKEMITGVPSGFQALDGVTAGFQPSDLIVLAARPGMGKTALAMSIAQNVGINERKAVAIFSLEMSKEQLVLRLLCAEARVENTKVRTGHLGDHDFPKLVEAASRIAEAPIFIDDTPALTITDLRTKCRRQHRDTPLALIVVDYLQLMRSPLYSNSREQEIADISRSLKSLAKELNVPVIALSQLNRSVESRETKKPQLSDLRESGAIEQDADIIIFIYRDEVYNKETTTPGIAEVIIAKQRSGPTDTVKLSFNGRYTRFDNLELREGFDNPGNDSSELGFSIDGEMF